MGTIFAVGVGGGLGALLRYYVAGWVQPAGDSPRLRDIVEPHYLPPLVEPARRIQPRQHVGDLRPQITGQHQLHRATAPVRLMQQVGGGADGKNECRALATRLFPSCATSFERKKDAGRAEAALLAYYGAKLNSEGARP